MATFYASKTGEVSAREKEHSALVRELAGECMTLLENDGTLPLAGAGKVAVYGNGVRHTVKGGTGSGDVNTRTVVTIEQGLKEAGFEILTGKWLDEYDKVLADAQAAYQAELAKKAEELHVPIFAVMFSEVFAQPDVPVITEKADTDTAIYVLSRNSGEGADRYNRACDYLLGENELADIAYLAEHYEKTVLILNIANLVDTTELKKIKGLNAILLAGQAGNATGNIVADVVLGKSIPSGKLTDTWAASYEDYPSSKNFSHNNGDTNDEYYSDGIYVGYRYFDTFNVTPNYCFGYGKGYTDFETEVRDVEADAKNVTVTASVKNIGDTFAGKEVVQVYYSAPDGTIEKPYQELGGFGKSDLLSPGESQTITISFPTKSMASYDEKKAAWVAWFIEVDGKRMYAASSDIDYKVYDMVNKENMPYGLAVASGNGTFSYPQEKNSLFETYLGFSDWINGKASSIGSFQKELVYKYCSGGIISEDGKSHKIWDYQDLQ